jgi:predicted DNA-binding transcriptional regulator AlpA
VQDIGEIHKGQVHDAPIVPAWLDTRQAEAYTSLCSVTLWRLRKENKIQAAQIGRAVRYSRESLDDYMRSCCQSA